MKTKTLWISIISVLLLFAIAMSGYYYMVIRPHQQAVSDFNSVKTKVAAKNKAFNRFIKETEMVIEKKEEALDNTTLEKLKTSVSEAKKEIVNIPKMKSDTNDIRKQITILKKPLDYSPIKNMITSRLEQYENSVKQLKQITNPSQTFVEERLKEIATVTGIQSVTEDNDPNGLLNKQGGYTASIYFSDSQVTQMIEGDGLIDIGTEAGGNIEVYATKEDAERRNQYLSAFDGQGFLNPGSHYIYGTVLIRTSSALTASQQSALTEQVYSKLIELR